MEPVQVLEYVPCLALPGDGGRPCSGIGVGAPHMSTWELLTTTWAWEPTVLVGCIALGMGYLWLTHWRLTFAAALFLAGVFVLLISLISPLDTLGDTYLFSVHMIQ